MPRTNRPPSYRLHKARNCAVVTINGRNHYLGPYGSPESHERYARLVAEWRANGAHLLPTKARGAPVASISINALILAYFHHVQTYYVKDGRPTSEQDNIRQALRFLRLLYGTSSAMEFGPLALKNVRQAMIEARRCRNLINKDTNRIRGMFGWAVENELLPVQIHQALQRVKGLRKGRSAAKESTPVKPVAEACILAILPHLSPQVAAMVQLQYLSGCRPQEVISIRPCEVNIEGNIWLYQPSSHKTEHFDRGKVIMLGPKAQAVLKPWLHRDSGSYCFVPAEVVEWHYRRNRRRKSDSEPPHCKGARPLKRPLGKRYTRHSYRIAVQRACRRSGTPVWSPLQLRHTRATEIRQSYGLEAAKSVLGHTYTKITEIYAERDLELAARVMQEIG